MKLPTLTIALTAATAPTLTLALERCFIDGWVRCGAIRSLEMCTWVQGGLHYLHISDCPRGTYCRDIQDGNPDCRTLVIPCVPYGCKITDEIEAKYVEAARNNITLGVDEATMLGTASASAPSTLATVTRSAVEMEE